MFEPIEILIPVITVILIILAIWKPTRKLVLGTFAVVVLILGACALQNVARAEEYDVDAEVISIIYIDDIVEFDDGSSCFEFSGGVRDHRLGDVLHVVMENNNTPTRKDDIIIESEHVGETFRVETYYIVAVDNVAWGAFVFQEDAKEFVKELTKEYITAQLIRVG